MGSAKKNPKSNIESVLPPLFLEPENLFQVRSSICERPFQISAF